MFNINDMDLQDGLDYITQNGIVVHHPSLKEIKEFKENKYSQAVSVFTSTPYDYMIELEECGTDFLELSNYDLFLSLYSSEEIQEACRIFLNDYHFEFMMNTQLEEVVLYDSVKDVVIDRLIYEEISTFIKRLNMIPLNPPYDLENLKLKPFMKTMILEDMKAKRQRLMYSQNIKKQSELSNNIRFLIWNNMIGYNYNNIWDLKIYQFYEGLVSLQKTDNYKNTMVGIYSGNVDSSKLNLEDIHWASRLKIN